MPFKSLVYRACLSFLVMCCFLGAGQAYAQEWCRADFFFTYLDSTTVHFYNNSTEYDTCTWSYGQGELVRKTYNSITVDLPSGSGTMCLAILDEAGCTDTLCLDIYPGAPGEVCTITDCVWPGDANGDWRANHFDVLHIGMGYGKQGPPRTYYPVPDDSLAWRPSHAEDWDSYIGVVNYKHLDCDGNGWINADDLEAVAKNYRPDQQYVSEDTPDAPPVELVLDETVFFLDPEAIDDSVVVTGKVYLGSQEMPVDHMYGLALSVRYDTTFVRNGTATLNYISSSFLGEDAPLLDFSFNLDNRFSVGRTDYALSRTKRLGSSGHGAVATFSLVIEGDIIGGREFNDINVRMEKIKAVDSLGREIPLNLVNDELTVFVVSDDITSTRAPQSETTFAIFPNPSEGFVFFRASEADWSLVEIFDVHGRRVLREPVRNQLQTLDIAGLPGGTYLVRAWKKDGSWSSQVLVRR